MALDNEQIVRKAYQIAEDKDLKGWAAAFTDDGTFTDESIGVTWRSLPFGTLPPTGKRMDAPCCDVFELAGDKIKRFDCYPEGSIILTQLGVIANLGAALEQ